MSKSPKLSKKFKKYPKITNDHKSSRLLILAWIFKFKLPFRFKG